MIAKLKTKRRHILSSLLLAICLLSSIISTSTMKAASNSNGTSYIIDDANLLSTGDLRDLNDLADKYSNKHDVSIVVITTADTNELSTTDYASMYYDTYIHGKDGYNDNCVLFLIDMDHRSTNIFAYEDAAIRMNTERSDKILDVVTPKLKEADYNSAIQTFIKKTNTYLGTKPSVDPDNIFFQIWFQLVLAIIIGAVSVGIMVHNSGGRVTTNSATYLDHNNSKLTGCYDHYIRTTTTRRKKPENNDNNGGGGSSGGTTGGGSSFSSGHERSF